MPDPTGTSSSTGHVYGSGDISYPTVEKMIDGPPNLLRAPHIFRCVGAH